MRCLSLGLAVIFLAGMGTANAPAQVKPPVGKEVPAKPPDKDKQKPSISEIGGKTLEQWIKESAHTDPGVRENAVRTIMLFGDTAASAAPAMIARLLDPDVSLRVNACLALSSIDVSGPDIQKAVDALARRTTDDRESIVRFHAALALGTFGKDAKSAIASLITASKDPYSWEIRKVACFALGKAGAAIKEDPMEMRAVNALLYVMGKDISAHVRLEAATALGSMGRPALASDQKIMEDALKLACRDQERTVQIWAAVGVMAINDKTPETYLEAVAKVLKAPELSHRIHAARALGTVGARAVSRVPDLIEMLNDKQRDAQIAAVWALGHIGDGAYKAIPPLKELHDRKETDEPLKNLIKDAIEIINGKKKPDK